MRNRWVILAILFTVRLTVAFQFQSVAAVAPLLGKEFGVSIAEIGFLIGLYFTPGVALALPGGAIGRRFGDIGTTLLALALMLIGSLMMALGDAWHWQIAGRLVGGAGAVLLNVQLTKMVTDWFTGQEIATAMAIFVNSWPAGVAISLLTLPSIAITFGIKTMFLCVTALMLLAILLTFAYKPPPSQRASATSTARLDTNTMIALTISGLIWGLFNVGFAVIFSFGPTLLVERGWTIAQAGSVISIVLWIATISVPSGGLLSDHLGKPRVILVVASLLFAAFMLALAHTNVVIATVIAIGIVSGLPAGPTMSLPSHVLQPATRALGMGLFYTLYFAAMMLGPMIAGAAAKWTGTTAAALDVGAAALVMCPLLLVVFNRIAAGRVAGVARASA